MIAGLVYGFNPFRIAHFPQIQVMTSYWMPLALLGLHEYVDERGRRDGWWLFGVAWLMQALSNGYYLLFFPVLIGLWIGVVRAVAIDHPDVHGDRRRVGRRVAAAHPAAVDVPAHSRGVQLSARCSARSTPSAPT